jgi:hypothetical protein
MALRDSHAVFYACAEQRIAQTFLAGKRLKLIHLQASSVFLEVSDSEETPEEAVTGLDVQSSCRRITVVPQY